MVQLTGSEVGEPIELLITADAGVGAVLGNDQAVGAQGLASVAPEDVALHENLVVAPRVDRLIEEILVQVVVHVLVAEAAGGTAGAAALPVVVVVGDVQSAEVDVAEGVAVADEGGLPVVVEVVPRNGDPIRCAADVNLTVLFTVRPSV